MNSKIPQFPRVNMEVRMLKKESKPKLDQNVILFERPGLSGLLKSKITDCCFDLKF